MPSFKSLAEPTEPKFVTLEKAPSELLLGERADVSWISTEDPDRDREVVIARGMDDSHFRLNPIVTLQHCYSLPPVGWPPHPGLQRQPERPARRKPGRQR